MTGERATREQILWVAGETFAELGFERATVRTICDRASVNLASVNYHFGDKQSLYLEAVRHAYQSRSAEVPMPRFGADIEPTEQLRGFVRTLLTRMLGDDSLPWQSRLLMREVLHPTAACAALVREYFRPQIDTLLGIVDQLAPPTTSSADRLRIAFSILGQCVFYRVAGGVIDLMLDPDQRRNDFGLAELVDHIVSFSVAALQSSDALSSPDRPPRDSATAQSFKSP